MLVLLDNNVVDRDGLTAYLSASPLNRAAIPQTLFVEWHKGDAEKVTRKVLQNVCREPKRFVILRDTQSIIRMPGGTKRVMERLIDRAQTRDLSAYCETCILGKSYPDLSARFAAHGLNAKNQAEALTSEAEKLMQRYAAWDAAFTPAEHTEMHDLLSRSEALSDGLQMKTYLLAVELGRHQLERRGLSRMAMNEADFINTLAFRYGAMTIALYITWRNAPRTYPTNRGKMLNHLMDIKIGAQASYFDDLLTNDGFLKTAFRVCMGLITELGGYRLCGRYEPVRGFNRPLHPSFSLT